MHDEPVLMHRFPCPDNCDTTPNFELYTSGGDGTSSPVCAHIHQAVNLLFLVICILMLLAGFVGYDNSLDSIIVSHQGPDKKKL